MSSVECSARKSHCPGSSPGTEPLSDPPKEGGGSEQRSSGGLRSDVIWHLAAQPLYLLLQSSVHEGTHAVTAIALGNQVDVYRPYPHVYSHNGQRRVLFTGRVEFSNKVSIEENNRELAIVAAMPMLVDVTLFTGADLALSYTDPTSVAAPFTYFAGMVWPWIDFTLNMNLTGPGSDLNTYAKQWGISPHVFQVTANLMAAVGGWRLYHQGKRTLIEQKPPQQAATIRLQPRIGRQQVGVGLSGAF